MIMLEQNVDYIEVLLHLRVMQELIWYVKYIDRYNFREHTVWRMCVWCKGLIDQINLKMWSFISTLAPKCRYVVWNISADL